MTSKTHVSDTGRVAVWTIKKQNSAEAFEEKPPPEHGPESVRENDERSIVFKKEYQDGGRFRSIVKIHSCYVDSFGTERWTMGTGWLIRPDLVVTAGHNVWSKAYGGQSSSIKCWIGYHGHQSINDKAHVQCRSARNVVTTESWVTDKDSRLRDVAFIQVDQAFTGQLNNFAYIDTPVQLDSANIGIVGYPGDKAPKTDSTDKGAEMWQEFKLTKHNLGTNDSHMIEYMVSTFGGQSGAPVLWVDPESGEFIAIGTHCYGNGTQAANTGNSIGGKYGNNYKAMEALFGQQSIDLWGQEKKIMNLQSVQKDPVNEESFWDVFREVAKVGSIALPMAGSILGPVGTLVGTAAGGLLNVVARRSEGAEGASMGNLEEVATSRALLAEATLQSVIRLGRSSESEEVFKKMEKIWTERAGNVAGLSQVFGPVIADCGVHIISEHWVKNIKADPSARKVLQKSRNIPHIETGTTNAELLECLIEGGLKPLEPLEGEGTEAAESFVSWTKDLLEKGLSLAKPIATKAAKMLIKAMVDSLEKHEESAVVGSEEDQREIKTILHRTMMADCALQALEEFSQESKEKLGRLTLFPTEAGIEEGFIDSIKTAAQKIGPIAHKYGKEAFKKYLPVILKLAEDHLVGKANNEGALKLNGGIANGISKRMAMTIDGTNGFMFPNGHDNEQGKSPEHEKPNEDEPPLTKTPVTSLRSE